MADAPARRGPAQGRKRLHPLVKVAVAVGLLAVLGFLFIRSVRDSRSKAYDIPRAELGGWTLALEDATEPTAPLLVLQAPAGLARGLFSQIFARAMESFSMPTPAMPLVLRGEFDRALAGRVTPEALMAAARSAGLESFTLKPRCLGYRRVSTPTATRQLYFMLFDSPPFAQFRQQVAGMLEGTPRRAEFDAAALSPVLLVAATDAGHNSWLPLRANPDTDCVAPIALR